MYTYAKMTRLSRKRKSPVIVIFFNSFSLCQNMHSCISLGDLERFPIECRKTNIGSKQCNRREERENICERVTIVWFWLFLVFFSDWLRKVAQVLNQTLSIIMQTQGKRELISTFSENCLISAD